MAILIRRPGQKAAAPAKAGPKLPGLKLPTEPSTPLTDFKDYGWLLFGDPGVGKTSLVSCFPDTLFVMTEPGGKALSILQTPCKDWPTFLAILGKLEGPEGKRYKTVAVDVIELLYDQCFAYICQKQCVSHPQDAKDHGKTWKMISQGFSEAINRLLGMGKGVFLISHAKLNKVELRDGSSFDQLGPSLPGQAFGIIEAAVDMIGYYGKIGNGRELVIRGGDFVCTKCRPEENFFTQAGDPVISIPMGGSKHEGYKNLLRAFGNRQVRKGQIPTVKQRPAKRS